MSLAHPIWLVLLILLPVIAVGGIIAGRRMAAKWSALVAGRLRDHLIRRTSPIPRWLSFGFLLAGTAAIIVALARPQGDGGTSTEKSLGRNLLVALDLSRSMRVKDVQPDRLSLAKLVIYELLEAMPSDRIGLIGFAGNPYLYAPLTIDHAAVRETVEQMDESWPTSGGSDLGAAVRLGIETLNKTGQRNNAMVILTDGEKHRGDLDEMIAEARESGVYILTIGVGSEDGDYVPHSDFPDGRMLDRNGTPVISRLQADVLKELARETGGAYALAGSGADIPNMVQSAIAGLEAFEVEGSERKVFIEFYQWLLLPAILLLIASIVAGTRWRGLAPATATGCLLMLLASPPADAQEEPSPQEAATAMQLQRYRRLADEALFESRRARYRLGEADAAYQLQTWNLAQRAYSQALTSANPKVRTAAHHGLGNVLFQKGWLRFMPKPYSNEPQLIPAMELFEDSVRRKLAELKQGKRVRKVDPDDEDAVPPFSYGEIEQAIISWCDAVRHFQSVLAIEADHAAARQNKALTMAYLQRLEELLREDEQQTQDSMPEPQPEPDPGDSGDPQQGDGGEQQKDPQQGSDPQNPQDGQQGEDPGDQQPNNPPQNQGEDPGDRNPGDQEPDQSDNIRPGESPEERARRILRENADVEKGPLTPGRIEFRRPEKDW